MKNLFTFAVVLTVCFFLVNCYQNPKNVPPVETSDGSLINKPANGSPTLSPEKEPERKDKGDKKADPEFRDFAVNESFSGKTPPLKFTEETREFKTRLSEAANGKPNFAGQYILAQWGCGTDCVMGGLIDAKTGDTYLIPFTVCCPEDQNKEKIDFRPDSNLIIFNGLLDEAESETKVHYYKFENSKFVPVSSQK